jgi:transcription-repair coupling factor (superfamily II helicase)
VNTLRGTDIRSLLSTWKPYKAYRDFLKKGRGDLDAEGASGALPAFLIAEAAGSGLPVLVIVPGQEEAEDLVRDLEYAETRAEILPWWQTLPYKAASPRSPAFARRSKVLSRLGSGEIDVLICPERSFLSPLPPPDYIASLAFMLRKGDEIDPETVAGKLATYGYLRVPRVSVHGEFALRGEVLDLWMPADDEAVRISLDFDRIGGIKRFEAMSQASLGVEDAVTVYPMKELVWGDDELSRLERILSDRDAYPEGADAFLSELREKGEARGEESFFALASPRKSSLVEHLKPRSLVFFLDYDREENAGSAIRNEFEGLYGRARLAFPSPPPDDALLDFNALHASLPMSLRLRGIRKPDSERLDFDCEGARSFFGNIDYFKEEIGALLDSGTRILIFAETEIQAERIRAMLDEERIDVIPHGLSSGFRIPQLKLLVIQEGEIFGRKKRVARSVLKARSVAIDSFVDLSPGDAVVHVNYGIGRFLGIERMRVAGNERDYVKLQYAEEENVFIPIEQVNLVQRYIGNEGNEPRLDRIGSKSWEKRKTRVKKSVEDIAERLIRLYSRRKAAKGYAFPADSDWQTAFEAAFPYEETEDQLACVEEIKADMERPVPMDRMVCGDVGFGKTEVAVRACFKAIMGGKQVAFLAPTTILAEQHYENFQERFSKFPVRIGMLSRLVEKAEQRVVLEKAEKGEVDIVVGTHRILQRDIHFKDLGLLVIDEEQRFGVKDKERLKEFKASVDCLTLTATPIPRTLHMSLLKVRDMSILSTPPSNRQAVQTIIEERSDAIVAEAIRREIARGGQVFYLHNRVEDLDEACKRVSELVPEAMAESAHGQMDSEDLEDVMHRFVHGGFQVLVSTTIIENGIDIPNVNTILIDRADMFGISQLYQLKGRVGRSDRLAYAYLLYPAEKALSELAMKRLQIVSDFTELGSGFKIAMKDLEVRGAGNLLGSEQSGDIYSVGFELYMRLLDDAVRKLSDENWNEEEDAYLELEYSGFIPDDYVSVPMVKMEVYKKIAGISSKEELERLHAELRDRFGPVPDEAASLLSLAEIRILCKKLGISSLRERQGQARVEFSRVANVSVERLIRMMRESPDRVKLDPDRPNAIILKTGSIGLEEKSEFIREKLDALCSD